MDSRAETQPTIIDAAKLFVASLVVLGSIVGYYYYANESMLLRVIGVLIAFAFAVWLALQSFQGQLLWKFIQGSRVELRKVVWPTREEAIQTTAIVLVFAMIGGAFFWLLDLFLLAITQYIRG
jgi:preprotein translocase subunit SecE